MHYKKLLKAFVLFSFCLNIVYASSSYIVEEEPRLVSNVTSSYSPRSSMTNLYSLWNKVKQTVSSFLMPSYETLQTYSSFENQNSSWWEAPTLKGKQWEEQWNTMVMFVVQDNLEHSRLLASTAQYRKAILASPEGINLAKHKKLSKMLGFEARREAIQDKLFNMDARHLHLTKYSQFLACFRAEERCHLSLFRNVLRDFYQKVGSTSISGDYYDGDLFQKGSYLAKCLWEIGKLERKAANLHILKNIIRQSYTAINGGIIEAWLSDKLKAVNVITPSKPTLLTTSSIKGPFFLFFTLSASLINVASALNRGGALSNACSDTYKGCETGFTLLDFYDSNPEITSLLSNNLFLNATQQALLEPNRVTALNNVLEISNMLSNTTGWYSEVTAFSVDALPPTGYATREIYSLPAPFTGSRYSIINSTAFNQEFYQIYDTSQPINNSAIFAIKYPYPANFFFTDQFPNTEIWFFPVMINSSFGVGTAVMLPAQGNPYLLWQRAITSDSSNNRADTLNLSGKLLDTNIPTRAITEQGNTPDDLALLHRGFVGEPDCQGNQTISQYLNFQSSPVTTLANSFISCMQKTGLDPLACPRTTAQYPSLVLSAAYFRLSYSFMEKNPWNQIFTRKVVDGPNYQSCTYTELGSQQTREECHSYLWAPSFDNLNSTSRVINQNLSSFSGSLIPGHVHKIFEYFFSNPSTDGIVVHTMQNATGVFGPDYYAYCAKQGSPSSNPTIINPPISSPSGTNEPNSNPADSSGLSDGVKAAIGVSVSAAVLGTGAGILGAKLKRDKEGKIRDQELGQIPTPDSEGDQATQKLSANAFSIVKGQGLEEARMKITGTMYGHKYGLYFKIDQGEAEEITRQTGLEIKFPPDQEEFDLIVGTGGFGQVRIAREEETEERKFRAIKIVVGNENVKDSLNEGVLQEKLNGEENVLPLLEYRHFQPTKNSRKAMAQLLNMAFGSTFMRIQDKATGIVHEKNLMDDDLLLQIMPLAAFGTGWAFQDKIALLKDLRLKNKLLTYVAYSLLKGLRITHSKNISHNDIKPSNILLHTDGTVYVSDYGCARPGDEQKQEETKGDIAYFSPERLREPIFSGYAADAWAAGVSLVEMAINGYPFDCETDAVGMLNNWNKAYYEKALSEAFAEAKQIDILPVLKRLLAIDPQERWNAAQAQEALGKLLSQDSPALLFHQLDDALLENDSYSPREAVNNNKTHIKRRYTTSQDYRAYHEVQRNYNNKLTLVHTNNNSRSYLVPRHNNK